MFSHSKFRKCLQQNTINSSQILIAVPLYLSPLKQLLVFVDNTFLIKKILTFQEIKWGGISSSFPNKGKQEERQSKDKLHLYCRNVLLGD